MKNQFSNNQEKQHYLNKLLLEDCRKLADDAIKQLDFSMINYNAIEHSLEYYFNLVQHYAGIISFNFEKLNIDDKYFIEFSKWELTGTEITNYLNKLKLSAAIKVVDRIYYNAKDLVG